MNLYNEALRRFTRIYSKVQRSRLAESTAVTLATADSQGRPSARVVLLKGFDERGFVFYTNLKSRKGSELVKNPHAALCFYWDPLDDQIRVEGKVRLVSDKEADAYWRTRPLQSQIGAWASQQSHVLSRRAKLLLELQKIKARYRGKPIPRLPHWSGFRVVPDRIEFLKRRLFRLHERIIYKKSKGKWTRRLLYP